jgi:hypothetical protein
MDAKLRHLSYCLNFHDTRTEAIARIENDPRIIKRWRKLYFVSGVASTCTGKIPARRTVVMCGTVLPPSFAGKIPARNIPTPQIPKRRRPSHDRNDGDMASVSPTPRAKDPMPRAKKVDAMRNSYDPIS